MGNATQFMGIAGRTHDVPVPLIGMIMHTMHNLQRFCCPWCLSLFILLLPIGAAFGGAQPSAGRERNEGGTAAVVRIMTWNIRYDNPDDGVHAWPLRRDTLVSFVAHRHVDVLCIQEGLHRQVKSLKDGLTGFDVRGVGRDDGKEAGEYTAIYFRQARFSCLATGTFWLSPTPAVPSKGWDAALPRIATWVHLRDSLEGGDLYVFNTHFDHMGVRARENSARLLREKVRAIAGEAPFILTGDFNASEKDSCYRILTSRSDQPPYFSDALHRSLTPPAGPQRSFTGFPFDSAEDGERIDFLFVNDAARVRSHAILDARRGPGYISDHLPVEAEIVTR